MTGRSGGNYVSEWFGYRTWPGVGGGNDALEVQQRGRCPFLSAVTREERDCVKNASSSGVCTINNHENRFAEVLQENDRWLAERIEGPNIANVFKRTFYQMMLKFQLGVHPRSVGTALAVPQAVWDSWQPHLGRPLLVSGNDGTHALRHPAVSGAGVRAWILVFDIDANSVLHPNPVAVTRTIATDAVSIARYALEDVPRHAFSAAGEGDTLVAAIHRRLSAWWPDLSQETVTSS